MIGCKTREVMRNEAYFFVRRRSVPQQMVVFQQPAPPHMIDKHYLIAYNQRIVTQRIC